MLADSSWFDYTGIAFNGRDLEYPLVLISRDPYSVFHCISLYVIHDDNCNK